MSKASEQKKIYLAYKINGEIFIKTYDRIFEATRESRKPSYKNSDWMIFSTRGESQKLVLVTREKYANVRYDIREDVLLIIAMEAALLIFFFILLIEVL